MMKKHLFWFYVVLILLSLPAGCQKPSPTITPTTATLPPVSAQVSTDTPVPPTPTATRTVTPTPTRTHTPFPTTTPTVTPTATPTGVPSIPPPSGLIYKANGSFWLVNDQGKSIFLLDVPPERDSVKFSYDGRYALHSTGYDRVFLIDLATGERTDLDFNNEYAMCCPQWWPGRPDVVLVGVQPTGMYAETIPAVIILSDRKVRLLGDEPTSYGPSAASPDGNIVAYTLQGVPWVYKWDASTQPFDVKDYGFSELTDTFFGWPVWSPDGHQLAWFVFGYLNDEQRAGIGIFDLDEQTSRFLYPYDLVHEFGGIMSQLDWSADEKHFVLHNFAKDIWWVLTVDGTEIYSSINQPGLEPNGTSSWSPDGQWLVMTSYNKAELESKTIFLSVNSTERYELDVGGNPVWGPDGQQVILSNIWLVKVGEWIPRRLDLPPGSLVVDWLDPQDVK